MTLLPFSNNAVKLETLRQLSSYFENSPTMPLLFLGHGSPMNAIEENEFVQGFQKIGKEIEQPSAILCISAHWETKGTRVTAMPNPLTIHDFGGFPKELYEVEYPAPGSPELATVTKELVKSTIIELDHEWGLDHGAWSVIKHLYPNANIPVIQMSIDYTKPASYHYELAKELKALRKKGVLIIGSGNLVHNLRMVAWQKINENYGYDWAIEANEKIKSFILNEDHQSLINFSKQGKAFELAIPTPEHFIPLLYTLGLKEKYEAPSFFNDKPMAGSLTMTSVKFDN